MAKSVLDEKMLARDTAQADLAQASEQEGAYVQSESGGDEAKILSSGFGIRGAAAHTGPVGQVQNVSLTEGDFPRSLDDQWDPVANRNSYETGLTSVDPVNGPYTQVGTRPCRR